MRKFLVLPDNTRVGVRRAEMSDIPGILELYNKVYSGKYTLPEATDAGDAAKIIGDSGHFWYLAVHKKRVIGSVIFAVEPAHKLGKVYAAVVLPEYQGK
ncbi:MAG TPA: hypothetical protein PKK26_07960, partial [Candidatus Wallbacteria bacterium]|nr:hypothetical protein [Candidatus Wallbacteria bacterium]